MKILIVGATGVFGKRVCELLSKSKGNSLVIAARDKGQLNILKSNLDKTSELKITVETVNISKGFKIKLHKISPDILINACGPYHEQDYSIAKECIKQKIHYIDLADNRDFVCNISSLNEEAQKQGVLVVSGASTVPALSSAIIENYKNEFKEIHELDYGVTPGNKTDRGVGTIAAILKYTGKAFKTLVNGEQQTIFGWQNLHREEIPVIGKRWMSNCNIPDLDLFPKKYPTLKTQRFYAGLELSLLHLGMWFLSIFSKIGILKSPEKHASILRKVSLWFYHFGSDKGAMHMKIGGMDNNGTEHIKKVYLIAEDGDGPIIPATPSVIIAKNIASGKINRTGAMPCLDFFKLDEFMSQISDYNIYIKEG